MSYRNQYSGSPWQQGGPPFGVGGYNQNYGGYNDQYGVSMMNTSYSRNQGGYGGGMYGGSGMGQMRNMGYGGPSPSRHYMNDRMSGRSLPRGPLPRKRLPQRTPTSGPRSKRPNIESDRRAVKSRRHRDSRGGSKSRHDRSDEEEDDTYNPEEPTDDASDVECESFEIWKCSDEDEAGEKLETKQNGEQETEATEGGEKDSKKSGDDAPKKSYLCYVCKVKCSSKEVLDKHNGSKNHVDKIEELITIRREKRKDSSDDKKDSEQDRKKSSRKPGSWCTVCECAFNGNFLAHRRTKEHRKKRDKKYPKCRPCRMGFSSSEEYRDHYKSEDHKQKSAEFHYLKNLASGSDEDEAAIEPVKIKEEEEEVVEKMEVEIKSEVKESEATETKDQDKNEETSEEKEKEKEDKKEEKEDKKEVKKSKPKEPKSVGQSFVVSVQGYYCKLCHKFFKDVSVAKSKHCRSIMHTDAFKKAMEEAIEQEEERQRLAEEQDKQDREAAEAAERAAEIVAIERAAKEAVKKEAAAKRAGVKKDHDVEMKDVSDDAHKNEDVKEEKGDEAAEEANVENGVKDDDEKDDLEETDDGKDEASDDKSKESESVKEEVPEEEQEETKEEVTSSPATRRGRGRGRGRKRR